MSTTRNDKLPVALQAFASTSIGGILVCQAAAERERFGKPAPLSGSSESAHHGKGLVRLRNVDRR